MLWGKRRLQKKAHYRILKRGKYGKAILNSFLTPNGVPGKKGDSRIRFVFLDGFRHVLRDPPTNCGEPETGETQGTTKIKVFAIKKQKNLVLGQTFTRLIC